jgi:HEPN domain-containing protein
MTASESVRYRLALAAGFLEEATQDRDLGRWRSCVDNSQLVVENSGKAVLLLYGVSPKTHDPGRQLMELLRTADLAEGLRDDVAALADQLLLLGPAQHVMTDYGDESTSTLPWDLFTGASGEEALATATRALALARAITARLHPPVTGS